MEQLIMEFGRLTNQKISTMKENLAAGTLTSMEEYKRISGRISGLRESLEIMDEAFKNIHKR
jgi:hypothetical protein